MLGGQLDGGSIDAGGRVVDQNVEVAEAPLDVQEHLDDTFLGREMAAQRVSLHPQRTGSERRIVGLVGVAYVVDQHVGAAPSKFKHDGAADAAAAASYQRKFSKKFLLAQFSRDRKSTRLNSSHLGISYA